MKRYCLFLILLTCAKHPASTAITKDTHVAASDANMPIASCPEPIDTMFKSIFDKVKNADNSAQTLELYLNNKQSSIKFEGNSMLLHVTHEVEFVKNVRQVFCVGKPIATKSWNTIDNKAKASFLRIISLRACSIAQGSGYLMALWENTIQNSCDFMEVPKAVFQFDTDPIKPIEMAGVTILRAEVLNRWAQPKHTYALASYKNTKQVDPGSVKLLSAAIEGDALKAMVSLFKEHFNPYLQCSIVREHNTPKISFGDSYVSREMIAIARPFESMPSKWDVYNNEVCVGSLELDASSAKELSTLLLSLNYQLKGRYYKINTLQ